MKKIKLFVLTIIVATIFVACDGAADYDPNEQAIDAWHTMTERLNDAGSFRFSFEEMKVLFHDNGDPIELITNGTVRKITHQDGNTHMALSIALSMAGATNEVDVFFHDDYLFFNFMGERHKREADLETAAQIMYAKMPDLTAIPILLDGIGEGSRRGTREMNFVLDNNAELFVFLKDSILDSFRLRNNNPDGLPTTIEIFGPVAFVVEIGRDHAFLSYTLAFTADISFWGEDDVRVYYEIRKTAEQIGGVTVDLPDDLDTYIDVTHLP